MYDEHNGYFWVKLKDYPIWKVMFYYDNKYYDQSTVYHGHDFFLERRYIQEPTKEIAIRNQYDIPSPVSQR